MGRIRRKYFARLFIGFDQFVNVIFGGDPDETISARAWRQRDAKKRWMFLQLFVDRIFLVLAKQENHCEKAYLEEMNRSQISEHYKK